MPKVRVLVQAMRMTLFVSIHSITSFPLERRLVLAQKPVDSLAGMAQFDGPRPQTRLFLPFAIVCHTIRACDSDPTSGLSLWAGR
jgi:hypothetical protein